MIINVYHFSCRSKDGGPSLLCGFLLSVGSDVLTGVVSGDYLGTGVKITWIS